MHREAQESVYIHRGKNQVSRLLRPWHPHSSPDVSARPLSIQTQKTEFCCQPIRLQLVNLHMPLHLEQKAPREVFKKKLRAWGSGMKNAGGGGCLQKKWFRNPAEKHSPERSLVSSCSKQHLAGSPSLQNPWEIVLSSVQGLGLHWAHSWPVCFTQWLVPTVF